MILVESWQGYKLRFMLLEFVVERDFLISQAFRHRRFIWHYVILGVRFTFIASYAFLGFTCHLKVVRKDCYLASHLFQSREAEIAV